MFEWKVGEMMCIQWLVKLFNNSVDVSKVHRMLSKTLKEFDVIDPIQKYLDGNSIYYNGDRVEMYCVCDAKKARKAFVLHSFRVLDNWSNIHQCKIAFSKKEYDSKYSDDKAFKIKEYLTSLKNNYEKAEDKDDFDGIFGETIITICEILSDYHQLEYGTKEEILILFSELIEEIKEYQSNGSDLFIDKIKMEREYLAKLRENRSWYKTSAK